MRVGHNCLDENQKISKNQAIAAVASEIILWQTGQTKADVYSFDLAKKLAKHLFDNIPELNQLQLNSKDAKLFFDAITGRSKKFDSWQKMNKNAKISSKDQEKLDKLNKSKK